jgi:hypothetical protein
MMEFTNLRGSGDNRRALSRIQAKRGIISPGPAVQPTQLGKPRYAPCLRNTVSLEYGW